MVELEGVGEVERSRRETVELGGVGGRVGLKAWGRRDVVWGVECGVGGVWAFF